MSQAFTKEGDASEDLPERPVSSLPNYVTPAGMAKLRAWKDELLKRHDALRKKHAPEVETELKGVLRDLRYVEIRIGSAILVDRSKDPPADVRFGATVELSDGEGVHRWTLVGEDEADAAQGKLSWSSPLALALIGAKAGAPVTLPDGKPVTVVAVLYLRRRFGGEEG